MSKCVHSTCSYFLLKYIATSYFLLNSNVSIVFLPILSLFNVNITSISAISSFNSALFTCVSVHFSTKPKERPLSGVCDVGRTVPENGAESARKPLSLSVN